MNARYQLVAIVRPVDDEEPVLESNARLLLDYLRSEYPFRSSVVVADDASTDGMAATGSRLGALEPQVSFLRLERKGSWPRAAGCLARERGRRRLVHGRRPLDRPDQFPPARRAASLRSLRGRDRHPAGPLLPCPPPGEAGGLFPWLQPAAGRIAAYPVAIPPVTVGSFLANRPWTFADEH